ncbi:MAG: aminotransferase class V-fold PLP-dependent enzyme, partial [Candidatus Eisenbacteria bacterium]
MQIYLDYNASSPLAPEVIAALRPYLDAAYGNPSSLHWAGRPAKEAIDTARAQVANLLGARPSEVVFTGGGTESDNFAVQGAFGAWVRRARSAGGALPRGGHFVTSAIEHPAVLRPMEALRDLFDAEVTEVGVDAQGRVSPGDIERALRPDTILVSIMHANNETGVIQPIAEIGAICRERGALFHT